MSPSLRQPTILVPGFLGGRLSLDPFRRDLRRRGISAQSWSRAPFLYRSPIHEHGKRLMEDLLEIRRRVGEPLTVVGWSEGGLVSVSAMIQLPFAMTPRPDSVVRRIITFGTPFHGAWSARLGRLIDPALGTSIREMRPGSPTLAEQALFLHDPREWDFRAIFGTRDWLVRPRQPNLDPDWCHFGPWHHRSLLYDPSLFTLIHRLILRP